jgi:hypothetical protein
MKMFNPKMCTLTAATVAAGGLLAGTATGAGKDLQPSLSLSAPQVRALTPDGTIVNANRSIFRGDAPGSGTPTGTTYSVDHLIGVSGGVGFFTLCDPSFSNADGIVTFDGIGELDCNDPGSVLDTLITINESVVITGASPNRTWDITLTSSVAPGDDIWPEVVAVVNGVPTTLTDGVYAVGLSDPLAWDSGVSVTTITWRTEDAGVELFNFDFSPAVQQCWDGVAALTVFNLALDVNGAQDLSEVNLVIIEDSSGTNESNCPWDIVPLGGPNGAVNLDDLLEVINEFGADLTSANNPNAPGRPNADIVPSPCGNWAVNLDDLLSVVNNFGDCPVQSGDDCASGPIALAGSSVSVGFDTTNATTDGPDHAGCDQFATGAETVNNDYWYCYTASCSGRVVIDTAGSTFDTKVAVYDGCVCPTDDSTLIACNDDDVAAAVLTSRISLEGVTAGAQLLIRVGGFGAADEGVGFLNVECQIPDNDNCIDAIAVVVNDTAITADNSDATVDIVDDCQGTAPAPVDGGRWYKFSPTGQNETLVATCGDNSIFGFTFYITYVNVYCAGCDIAACIGDSADTGDCALGPFSEISFCPDPSEEYLILVHGEDNSGANEGHYLAVTEGDPCANPVSCGLEGDFCANAFAISGVGSFPFDSTANSDTLPPGVSQCEFTDPQLQDIWFSWTSDANGTAIADICGADFDGAMSVFQSCDDVASNTTYGAVGCGDDNASLCAGTFQPEVNFDVTVGGTYVIVVSGWQGGGTGNLNIVVLAGGITGACCVEGACVGTTTETDCETANGPSAQWIQGEDCGSFTCPTEAFATSTCASNGTYDDVNGVQPAAVAGGWITSGVMDDFELAAACDFTQLRFDFLDNGGAVSVYNVNIYDLTNGLMSGPGGTLDDVSFTNDVPAYTENFSGGAVSKDTSNIFDGDGDPAFDDPGLNNLVVDRVTLTSAGTNNLPAARYGLWIQAVNGGSYFWATANATGAFGSFENGHIFGNDGAADVNADGGAGFQFMSFGLGE